MSRGIVVYGFPPIAGSSFSNGGTLSSGQNNITGIYSDIAAYVVNDGLISFIQAVDVFLAAGSTFKNAASGTVIVGHGNGDPVGGIRINTPGGPSGSVSNYGVITDGGGSIVQVIGGYADITNGSPSDTTALINGAVGGASLTNFGTITGGAGLNGPEGAVNGASNSTGAYISGSGLSSDGNITNYGTIFSTNFGANGGGTITNGISGRTIGTIVGVAVGVGGSGAGPETLLNYGLIGATGPDAVGASLSGQLGGGTIVNGAPGATTAIIYGYGRGVSGNHPVQNYGTIAGTGPTGVGVNGAGVVNGISGSTIGLITGVAMGVQFGGLTNYGVVSATGTAGIGVLVASVTNFGTIAALGGSQSVGVRGNQTTPQQIDNTQHGVIEASGTGVYLSNAGVALTNAGTINGAGTSATGVSVTHGATATNTATGVITGGAYGVTFAAQYSTTAITNYGQISGGVGVDGALHLTNGGTISGTGTAGIAASLVAGGSLTLLPGAKFNGKVVTGGYNARLYLAGTAATGNLYGLGSQYANFGSAYVLAGADWVLSGSGVQDVASGIAIFGRLDVGGTTLDGGTSGVVVQSGGTLFGHGTVQGPLGNQGVVEANGGLLSVPGQATTGSFTIDGGAGLAFSTYAGNRGNHLSQQVTFAGTGLGTELILGSPTAFYGSISGLSAGDTIDLAGVVASDPTLSSSALTFSVQSQGTVSFSVSGTSGAPIPIAESDGGTGTDIVMFGLAQPSAAAPNPVVIPNEHVGDAITQAVTLENTAPADSDYENLDATIGSPTAGITASGSFTGLAPQATDSTDLLVGLDTTTDGIKSGTATISLESDGTGIDNQGTTALPSQNVSVTGTVYALAAPHFAAPLTTLVSFNGTDGIEPLAGLVADAAGDLFGTTEQQGPNGDGTVFEIPFINGSYASTPITLVGFDGTDGYYPRADLIIDAAGDLFGTTSASTYSPVANGDGSVFEVVNTSTGYASTPTTLVSFNGTDGQNPQAGLLADANGDLFGTTDTGGQYASGMVFEMPYTDGSYASTPTVLASFTGSIGVDNYVGSDGAGADSGLIADAAGDLFGTTNGGGTYNDGVVFEIPYTDGSYASTPTTLVTFNGSNGANPDRAGVIADAAGDLFGTTYSGGANNDGTVFEIPFIDGTYASTPTILVSFNGTDGSAPAAGVIMDAAGDLFGTTYQGGSANYGTVFEIPFIDGSYASTPIILSSFNIANGAGPYASLIANADGELFGTTQGGGLIDGVQQNGGTVFELSGTGFQDSNPGYLLNFGAARVGDTAATQSVAITDGTIAEPYQESLVYSLPNTLPTGFTAVSGASGTVVSGGTAVVTLVLNTSTAGDFTGSTATLSLTSTGVGTSGLADTPLPSGTIDLNGKVYAPAVAQLGTTSLNFGVVHVGDTVTQAVTIANTATGALTDSLIGGFGTIAGAFTGSGTLDGAAGSFGTLTVGLDTTASGVETGSAALALNSHDADLPDIAVSAGPISLTGTVDNYATAALAELSGGGIFTQTGSDYALNLGTFGLGETPPTVDLEALNAASGLADVLSGTFQVSGSSAFMNGGTASFSGLGAGQADTEPTVSLSTAQIGTFSETLTLIATGSNSSLYSGTLAPETLTITGAIVSPGVWATDAPGDFDDPTRWTGDIVPTVTTSASIDFADDPQILHSFGSDTVNSLTNTAGDFVMAGGTLTTPDLENDSLMSWTSGALILSSGAGGIATLLNTAGASLTIAGNGQRLSTTGSGTASVSNAGTITVTGGSGTANIDAPLANTGEIVVNQGTLSLNGGGSSNGYGLQGGAGGTLQFGLPASGPGGDFVVTGGEYAVGNTTVDGGTLDLSAASSIFFIDSLRLAGAGTLLLGAQNATAQDGFLQGPTAWAGFTGTPFLSGAGTLTVYGGGSLIDGVESGSGLTRLIGTNQLGAIDLDGGRTIENDGWMTWSSGNIELGAGDASAATQSGTITNVLGATFYVTADARIGNSGAGTSQFDNAGVTAVFAGTGETDIDAYVDNTGYIQAQTGTLSLNGGGTSDGAHLYVTNGAVVQFGTMAGGAPGGTFSIVSGQYTAGDTAITGGTLDVSAASAAVFADRLAIGAGALLLGAQANAVVQGELLQTGGLLEGSELLAVYDGASLTGGVQSGPATTRLYGTSVLGWSFALDGGRTLENDGWLNWSSGNINLGSGDSSAVTQSGTLSNVAGATFYVTADGRIATSGAGSGTVDNAGVIAVFAGVGETDIDAALNDTGGLQVQSGVLGLNGGGTLAAGSLYVAPNALLQFGTAAATGAGATFTFTGGPYIASNTAVNAGVVDLSAVAGVSFGESLSIAGSGTLLLGGNFPGTANFLQSGGELSESGYFYVTGSAQLDGGLQTGSGRTVLLGGGSIGGSVEFDGGYSVENQGTLTWSGGSITLGGGDASAATQSATLINDAGAVFDIQTNGTINSAGFAGNGTINNAGTILSGRLGATEVYANLFNNGVVEVSEGTLALEQGVGGTGRFLLDGTATLDFVNGAASSDTMQFLLPGGTLEVDSTRQFGSTISGFAAGDVIDAGGVGFVTGTTTVGFNAGTLTVTNGAQSATFDLSGSYAENGFQIIGSDGHGGTEVGYS